MRDLRKLYKKFASATVLASILLTPLSAHAQMVVIDPMSIAKQIQEMMQRAATSFTASAASVKSDAVNTNLAQAHVDAVDKSVHDAAWLKTHKDYTVDPTTYKACRVAQGAAARSGLNNGISSLNRSMGASTNQGIGVNQAQQIASACKNGYIDSAANPTAAAAAKGGCSPDPTRVDADINSATLDQEMAMPKGLKMINGQIGMTGSPPGVLTVTDDMTPEQKAYVDGFNLCAKKRGYEPSSFGNMGSKANVDLPSFDDQRREKLDASYGYNACIQALNSHVAISQEASKINSNFLALYNTQQQLCAQLQDEGVTDPAVTNCKQNGISKSNARRLETARYSNPDYQKHLLGKNLTPRDVAMLAEQDRSSQVMQDQMGEMVSLLRGILASKDTSFGGGYNGMNMQRASK